MRNQKTTAPAFLSRGTYGCIFRPGISCKGERPLTDKYITKIHISDEATIREKNIGEKIQQIKNYEYYYAPILSDCEVSLSSVSSQEIKKCDILPPNTLTYDASKVRYVGKNTLLKHLLMKYKSLPAGIVREIIETYTILLDGFGKLSFAGIIHFDVKENNIMCEDRTGTPIIIDFGLSIYINEIAKNKYRDAFYVYGPDYGPWCLEIAVISYGANELTETDSKTTGYAGFWEGVGTVSWLDQTVTKEQIDKVVNEFVKVNDVFAKLITKNQHEDYRVKQIEHYSKYIGKSWKEMIEELQSYYKTWDNYGLAVSYLHIIKDLKLESIMGTFVSYLEGIVLSLPQDRPTCDQSKSKMKELFGKVKRTDKTKYQIQLKKQGRNQDEVHKQVWESIKNGLIVDDNMNKRVQTARVI